VVERNRILIVDDEEGICWALQRSLQTAGFHVTVTDRGAKAQTLATSQDYAAALVDAKLPDFDGLELVSWLQMHSPATGRILISGYYYDDDQAIKDAIAEGSIVGFIAKPFDLRDTLTIVTAAIDHSWASAHGK
jgi:DNA-binding NtrC family response regulator